jgi:hypothetical protein
MGRCRPERSGNPSGAMGISAGACRGDHLRMLEADGRTCAGEATFAAATGTGGSDRDRLPRRGVLR